MTAARHTVVFYVTGHGFGHASRSIEVVNALATLRPDIRLHLRSRVARWLYDLTVAGPFRLDEVETDTGVVQIDALRPDIDATLDRASAFYADDEALIARETRALREAEASLVVADVPPLAFAAAGRANIPSVALSNFTWDWIYEDYAKAAGRPADLAHRLRAWQGEATEAWRLPMHGGFEGFRLVRDLPLVARRSRRDPAEVRARLGWPSDRPIVLSSFGGIGLDRLPFRRAAAGGRLLVVACGEPSAEQGPLCRLTEGVASLNERALYDEGLRYEDLVAAVDVVVTKPGYGIIAECIANHTGLLYTSRGRFAEYDVLVAHMPRWLRSRFIDRESLLGGDWVASVEALLGQAAPPEQPAVDGARVAAAWIADLLES